jgi:hypothetical protein
MLPEGQHLGQISKSLRTSSAVAPALLLTLICLPVGAAGALLSDPPSQLLFLALASLPPLAALAQITFFTFFDRDRLQNEQHVENKIFLSKVKPELGDAKGVIVLDQDQALIGNPAIEAARDV